jgi:hypothetical protein
MYLISITKDGLTEVLLRTNTYVLAAIDPETYDPITKKDGDAALTIFLDMCLFAEAVGYLERTARLRRPIVSPGTPDQPPPLPLPPNSG